MAQLELNTKVAKSFVWSGILLVGGLIVAQGFMMHFVPAPDPSMPAEQLKQIFIDRKFQIQLGTVLQIFVWSFWATWCMVVTTFMRKMERGYPFLTYASITLSGGGSVFFLLIPMTWAVVCFRVESWDPQLIQFANDWVWFDWLFTWPPFAIWFWVIAAAIFNDKNVPSIYPRWVAYMNVGAGFLIFPAALIAFFHTGPFAYNGIGAFWFPVFIFFGEIVMMIAVSWRVINQQAARLDAQSSTAPDPGTPGTTGESAADKPLTPTPIAGG
jgi:hypothetical protein